MTYPIIAIAWYIAGFLGCFLSWYNTKLDFKVIDLVLMFLLATLGPIILLFSIIELVGENLNKTIYKRKG